MTRTTMFRLVATLALSGFLTPAAEAVVLDFDDFPTPNVIGNPGALIGNFYAAEGALFTTDWYAYSEDPRYPAHSGTTTAIGSPFTAEIEFPNPVSNVGAYFNVYVDEVTFSAFDSGGLLGSVAIPPTSQPTPGGPIYYELPFSGIESVTLSGTNSGFNNLDDLTFTIIPEPTSLTLACFVALAVVGRRVGRTWR